MPELHGMGQLKKMKGNVSLKNIPFIMLTASRDEELNKKSHGIRRGGFHPQTFHTKDLAGEAE